MSIFLAIAMLSSINLTAQVDSLAQRKLSLEGDFRFRVEQDWNSRNSDGTFSNDRSRFRYRFRFGLNYQLDKRSSFGGRLRSGNINDQQGPHITLGSGTGEFGLVQVGFEKLYYEYKGSKINFWLGKKDIILTKFNELFWNDNTYPEGIALKYTLFEKQDKFLSSIKVNLGHFIIHSNNQSFQKDSYLQVGQLDLGLFKQRLNLISGLYLFRGIGNIPDLKHSFTLDYSIFHTGLELKLDRKSKFRIGLEYYKNFENYATVQEMETDFTDQKNGLVVSAKWGKLQKKGNWMIHLYYANLQKYSIVDYFAQNDWARWDYSSFDARGSRISNFQGAELRIGYCLKEKFNLVLRSYFVEELLKTGTFKEQSSRVRLDLDIGIF